MTSRHRPRHVVVADRHFLADQPGDRGVGPAEQEHLARRLEIVVLDRERPRPVPAADGLRIRTDGFDIRDVGIPYGGGPRVERDAGFCPYKG